MKQLPIRTLWMAIVLAGVCSPSQAQNASSAEDLVKQAVTALAANDQPALDRLTIDQNEYKKYVWPNESPGSYSNVNKGFVTHQKVNHVGIDEATAALAGKKWSVVKVSLEAPRKKGKGYQLFGSPLITLKDDSGEEKTMRLIGGVLEKDGAYRVTSFYVSPSLKARK